MVEDIYPSRVGGEASLLPRKDPVVQPGGDGPLSPEQLSSYERDGFVALPGLISEDEAKSLVAEVDRLRNDEGLRSRPEVVAEPDSDLVRSVFRVHELSDPLSDLARDPRLVSVARQILASDVYIHQSRVNYKPAFHGRAFQWHSDFETWHVEDGLPRMRALSISVALTGNTEFNGPLIVIPGSHRHYVACPGTTPEDNYKLSLRQQEYGVPPAELLAKLVEAGGMQAMKGPPGTATVFDCNTMHGSGSNMSPFPRSNAFIVYNSVDNAAVEPFGKTAPRPEFIASRNFTPV